MGLAFTSGYLASSFSMMFLISCSLSAVGASNLRVRFGLVFEALTAPHEVSSNFILTPSMVMQS